MVSVEHLLPSGSPESLKIKYCLHDEPTVNTPGPDSLIKFPSSFPTCCHLLLVEFSKFHATLQEENLEPCTCCPIHFTQATFPLAGFTFAFFCFFFFFVLIHSPGYHDMISSISSQESVS